RAAHADRYPLVAIKIVASKPAALPTQIAMRTSNTTRMDLRYALRTLTATPGFTLVVILTLALGLGANTAIFSLTDQILLRRLPVERPEELVVVRSPGPKSGHAWSDGDGSASFSYPLYKELRDKNNVFSGLLARFAVPLS